MITHVKHKALILESIWRDRSLLSRRGRRGASRVYGEHEGIGCDYELTDRQGGWRLCVYACEQGVCIPTGPSAPSFHRDPLKNTLTHTRARGRVRILYFCYCLLIWKKVQQSSNLFPSLHLHPEPARKFHAQLKLRCFHLPQRRGRHRHKL